MNDELQRYARNYLKERLILLPLGWQSTFKLMYARDYGRRSQEDALALDINHVVDKMPEDKLDWAMQQVDHSLTKLNGT